MLALMSPPAIVAPCTGEPDLLLSHADYTLAARCAPAGDHTAVALTVRNRYRGQARIEEFHVAFQGRVLRLTAPAGWTVTHADAPARSETIVTWRAAKGSSVRGGSSVAGFFVLVDGTTTHLWCHRGFASAFRIMRRRSPANSEAVLSSAGRTIGVRRDPLAGSLEVVACIHGMRYPRTIRTKGADRRSKRARGEG